MEDEKQKWIFSVEKVDNGFIMEMNNETMVFEETGDSDHDELVCMVNLLWQIKEFFSIHHSKHNEENIEIKICKEVKGDEQ